MARNKIVHDKATGEVREELHHHKRQIEIPESEVKVDTSALVTEKLSGEEIMASSTAGDPDLVNDHPIIGSVVDNNADDVAVKRYEVVSTISVMNRGMRVTLKAGKILDERNYNLDSLTTQGVELREIPVEC